MNMISDNDIIVQTSNKLNLTSLGYILLNSENTIKYMRPYTKPSTNKNPKQLLSKLQNDELLFDIKQKPYINQKLEMSKRKKSIKPFV